MITPRAAIEKNESGEYVGVFYHLPKLTPLEGRRVGRGAVERGLVDFDETCDNLERVFPYFERPRRRLAEFLTRPRPVGLEPVDWTKYPSATRGRLLPHQLEVITKVVEVMDGKAAVRAPTGFGKTVMGCVVARRYGGRTLFVCPKAVTSTWASTYAEWCGSTPLVLKRIDDVVPYLEDEVVVVTSHDVAKRNASVAETNWTTVVVDESQKAKNPESIVGSKLTELLKRARCSLTMSATPMLNHVGEWYTQLVHVVGEDVLGTYEDFERRYREGYEDDATKKWIVDGKRTRNLKEFRAIMERSVVSVEDDAMNMPDRVRTSIKFDPVPDPSDRKSFDDDVAALRKAEKEFAEAKTDERRGIISLQMWRLTGKIKAPFVADWVIRKCAENPGEKWIVFAQHSAVWDYLERRFVDAGISTVKVTGKISDSKKRIEMLRPIADPNDFSKEVAVCSIPACGMGLTFSPGCSNVVMAEMVHTPAIMHQCEGRVWRIGAMRECRFFWFLANDTRDASVFATLDSKTKEISKITHGTSSGLTFDPFVDPLLVDDLTLTREEAIAVDANVYADDDVNSFVFRECAFVDELPRGEFRTLPCRRLGVRRFDEKYAVLRRKRDDVVVAAFVWE